MSDFAPTGPGGIPAEHLAALSHELRTPLNGVIGMARLLEGTPLTAEQRAYVAALTQSGEHLLDLVNDVLDYARLGAGRLELSPRPVDIEELLRSVCELLSPRADEKGLEVGWAAARGLAPVLADEGRLRQILLNFVGNAVKFVEHGGVVLLAESAPAGGVRFIVSDTGPGIPKGAEADIFEAFHQLDPTRASVAGAGLGLAIARRIAQAMGGEVGVRPAHGGGAEFWFEARLPNATPPPPRPSLDGRTVAVASPNAIVRASAARQIEACEGHARTGSTIVEALLGCGEGTVLLVDHASAGADARLRPPPGHPAVILLRPADRGRIRGYRQAGFSGYLIKPLRPASLVAQVLAAGGAAQTRSPLEDERAQTHRVPGPGDRAAGVRVLLVEDDPVNALLATALLRRSGCRVDQAANGAAALGALAASLYDLVLMDVRMPVMNGLAATRELRRRGLKIPIVALTANDFEEDRRACAAAGMNDVLVKPISAEALRAALDRWTGDPWTERPTRAKLAG